MAKQRFYIQAQEFELAGNGLNNIATILILKSFNDAAGNPITSADLNDVNYGTLEPGTDREEIISFTDSITVNADGTVTLNSVTRGLEPTTPYTANALLQKSHLGSAIFVLSNNPQIYKNIYDYIDNGLNAGAADASITIKGLVEVATSPEIDSGASTGGTTAPLAVTSDKLATSKYSTQLPTVDQKAAMAGGGTFGTPSTTNKFVTQEYTAKNFGDGSDGDVTISSPITLTRDMYYNNLVVTSILTTDGYRIFVKNTVSGTGTIKWGTPGFNTTGSGPYKNTGGSAGGAAYVGATSGVDGYLPSNGANGANGGSAGGGGQGAANGGTNLSKDKLGTNITDFFSFTYPDSTGVMKIRKFAGAAGGEGVINGSYGNAGGRGGSSGGIIFLFARNFTGTFTIDVGGGVGENGNSAQNSYVSFGGGGGGGGVGGNAMVLYVQKTWTGTYNLAGGIGGIGGNNWSGGGSGTAGSNGAAGTSYEFQINTLV